MLILPPPPRIIGSGARITPAGGWSDQLTIACPFSEGAGGTHRNYVNAANPGVQGATAWGWGADVKGNYFVSTGGDGAIRKIQFGTPPSLSIGHTWWIRFRLSALTSNAVIFTAATNLDQWVFWLTQQNFGAYWGLSWGFDAAANIDYVDSQSTFPIAVGTWYDVIATWHPNGQLRLYIDNVNNVVTGGTGLTPYTPQTGMALFCNPAADNAQFRSQGDIAYFYMYDRVARDSDVRDMFAYGQQQNYVQDAPVMIMAPGVATSALGATSYGVGVTFGSASVSMPGSKVLGASTVSVPVEVFTAGIKNDVPPMNVSGVVLRQVQHGTATFNSVTTFTVTLPTTLLDRNKAFLLFSLRSTTTVADPQWSNVSGEITNTSTLTFRRAGTLATNLIVEWYVAEFSSGVSVQHLGETQITTGGVIQPRAITAVDMTKSFVLATVRSAGSSWDASAQVYAHLTSSTNIDLYAVAVNSTFVLLQVVTMDNVAVRRGAFSMLAADTGKSEALSPAIANTNKALLFINAAVTTGTATHLASKMVRGRINSSTALAFNRQSFDNLTTNSVAWQLVEFTDGTYTASLIGSFLSIASGTASGTMAVSGVTPANSIAYLCGHNNTYGATSFSSDDRASTTMATVDVTNSTTVTLTRESTTAATGIFQPFMADFTNSGTTTVVPAVGTVSIGVSFGVAAVTATAPATPSITLTAAVYNVTVAYSVSGVATVRQLTATVLVVAAGYGVTVASASRVLSQTSHAVVVGQGAQTLTATRQLTAVSYNGVVSYGAATATTLVQRAAVVSGVGVVFGQAAVGVTLVATTYVVGVAIGAHGANVGGAVLAANSYVVPVSYGSAGVTTVRTLAGSSYGQALAYGSSGAIAGGVVRAAAVSSVVVSFGSHGIAGTGSLVATPTLVSVAWGNTVITRQLFSSGHSVSVVIGNSRVGVSYGAVSLGIALAYGGNAVVVGAITLSCASYNVSVVCGSGAVNSGGTIAAVPYVQSVDIAPATLTTRVVLGAAVSPISVVWGNHGRVLGARVVAATTVGVIVVYGQGSAITGKFYVAATVDSVVSITAATCRLSLIGETGATEASVYSRTTEVLLTISAEESGG